MTENRDFKPKRVVFIDGPEGPSLAVEDSVGAHVGVIIPPVVAPVLAELAANSSERLALHWRAYQKTHGGDVFFWDLVRLAEAIVRVPSLRPLLRFQSATGLFHNASQAQLMASAWSEGLNPSLVRVAPPERRPDFRIHTGREFDVEVKTVTRMFSAELREDGIFLSPGDVDRFRTALQTKYEDARTQVGKSGTVVIAVWCEFMGDLLNSSCESATSTAEVLQPDNVVLTLRSETTADRYIAVSATGFGAFVEELTERRLRFAAVQTLSFSSRFRSFARGVGTFGAGRVFAIADVRGAYTDSELRACSLPAVWPGVAASAQLRDSLKRASAAADTWRREAEHHPIEPRAYSEAEIRSDIRFTALLTWGAAVVAALTALEREMLLDDIFPKGRPRQDMERILQTAKGSTDLDVPRFLQTYGLIPMLARLTAHINLVSSTIAEPTLPGGQNAL